MKKIIPVLVLILIATSCKKTEELEGPRISHGTIVLDSIPATDSIVGVRPAFVYLPPGYNETQDSFPTVYLLHGYGGNYTFWQYIEDIKDIADYLISTGEIQPVVIVMPDGMNALGGSFYTDSRARPMGIGAPQSVFGLYETYIVQDVVNYIEAHYRVYSDKDDRAIIGISMGGYGAMKLGIKHPDVFGIIGAHSGPIFFDRFIQDGVLGYVRYEWMDSTFNGRIPFKPAQYLGPQRPLTTMLIAMAGAFSPKVDFSSNFDSTKYEIILRDSVAYMWGQPIAVGVMLPFDTLYQPNSVYDTVWLPRHDPATLFTNNLNNLLSNGTKIYIDCGTDDELFLTSHAASFVEMMQNLNYPEDLYQYEIFRDEPGYPNDLFPARHGTHLYFRIRRSLEFASRNFEH